MSRQILTKGDIEAARRQPQKWTPTDPCYEKSCQLSAKQEWTLEREAGIVRLMEGPVIIESFPSQYAPSIKAIANRHKAALSAEQQRFGQAFDDMVKDYEVQLVAERSIRKDWQEFGSKLSKVLDGVTTDEWLESAKQLKQRLDREQKRVTTLEYCLGITKKELAAASEANKKIENLRKMLRESESLTKKAQDGWETCMSELDAQRRSHAMWEETAKKLDKQLATERRQNDDWRNTERRVAKERDEARRRLAKVVKIVSKIRA
jgi:hypothetical protein